MPRSPPERTGRAATTRATGAATGMSTCASLRSAFGLRDAEERVRPTSRPAQPFTCPLYGPASAKRLSQSHHRRASPRRLTEVTAKREANGVTLSSQERARSSASSEARSDPGPHRNQSPATVLRDDYVIALAGPDAILPPHCEYAIAVTSGTDRIVRRARPSTKSERRPVTIVSAPLPANTACAVNELPCSSRRPLPRVRSNSLAPSGPSNSGPPFAVTRVVSPPHRESDQRPPASGASDRDQALALSAFGFRFTHPVPLSRPARKRSSPCVPSMLSSWSSSRAKVRTSISEAPLSGVSPGRERPPPQRQSPGREPLTVDSHANEIRVVDRGSSTAVDLLPVRGPTPCRRQHLDPIPAAPNRTLPRRGCEHAGRRRRPRRCSRRKTRLPGPPRRATPEGKLPREQQFQRPR